MRFKRRKTLTAGWVLAAIVLYVLARMVTGPSYHWKSLDTWLAAYDAGPKAAVEADTAIRAIGSAAVPELLKLMRATNHFGPPHLARKRGVRINVKSGTVAPPAPTTVAYFTLNGATGMTTVFLPGSTNVGAILGLSRLGVGSPSIIFAGAGLITNRVPGNSSLAQIAVPGYAQTAAAMFVDRHTPFHFERRWIQSNQQWGNVLAAFQALGPLGEPAIPELARLIHGMNDGPPLPLRTNSILASSLLVPSQPFQIAPAEVFQFASRANSGGARLLAEDPYFGDWRPFAGQKFLDGDLAAWSLAAIGPKAVPALQALLADSNPIVRERAALALGLIGPGAEPAIPALLQSLDDWEPSVRIRAAEALGNMPRLPVLAMPVLIEAMDDTELSVRFQAGGCLAQFGPAASNAIPVLRTNFSSFTGLLRESAAVALSHISPEITAREILPALLQDLRDSKPFTRNLALAALAQFRDRPPAIIPPVIDALDDTDERVRRKAILLLGNFGSAARDAIPKLIVLTKNSNRQIRQDTTNALDKIEPAWRNLGK
jgi:HEAT repeat protein